MNSSTQLTHLKWHKKSKSLTVEFSNRKQFELPLEYLRVYSPSAEVQGHGTGQEVLVSGQLFVNLTSIEPVGNYAIKLIFDDGHDSGLFTWRYLYELGINRQQNWTHYLDQLEQASLTREPKDVHILKL